MWQILYASFWKFSKLSNSGISLDWPTTDELTTRNTTADFLAHHVIVSRMKYYMIKVKKKLCWQIFTAWF